MEIDKILEGLSQEERLQLLERLVKEDAQKEASSEEMSLEERVKRLEDYVFGPRRGFGPRWVMRRHFFAGSGRGRCCDRPYDYQ
jgi:hypothetical protein